MVTAMPRPLIDSLTATRRHIDAFVGLITDLMTARESVPLNPEAATMLVRTMWVEQDNPNVYAAKLQLYFLFRSGTLSIDQDTQVRLAGAFRESLVPEQTTDRIEVSRSFLEKLLQERANLAESDEKPNFDPVLHERIEGVLDLRVKTANLLQKARIDRVWELCEKSDSDLLAIEGFGPWCLKNVKVALAEKGLSLNMKLGPTFPRDR